MKNPIDPVAWGGHGSIWLLILAVALGPISGSAAVSPELQSPIDRVRAALAAWDLQDLVEAADAMNRVDLPELPESDDLFWQHYWAGVAGFNAVLCAREVSSSEDLEPDLRALVDRAEDSLDEALTIRAESAECHAMLAVLDGLAISDRPWMAMFKGPSLMRHRAAAADAEPVSPRTIYLLGTAQLKRAKDTPEIRKSMETLRRAVDLFEAEASQTRQPWEPVWGYDHTLLFLGEAHQELAEWAEAVLCFESALAINPNLERARRGLEQCRRRTENRLS